MRLLFSAGAGYSHIAPMLPLAVTAQQAGHEVLFVTGADAVHHCTAVGLRAEAVGEGLGRQAGANRQAIARTQQAHLTHEERLSTMVAQYMVGIGAAARLDGMIACVRSFRPELVISNLAERAAVMAAAVVGVPYVMHAIGPPKSAAVMAEAWRVAGGLVRERGLAELPDRDDVPYLDIWPDALYPPDVAWEYPTRWPLRPEGVLPVEGPRPELLDGLPYEHTAYVTAGTTHNNRPGALESMVAALREEPVNLVVTIGRDGDRDRFGARPAHVRIEEFVAQQRLLPYVDIAVSHAGAGSVLGALAHGVPQVVTPLATDQFDTAAQLVSSGAGLTAEQDTVREAFRTVRTDPVYRDAACRIAGDLAAMPSTTDVLDRLVRHYAT